MFNFAAICLSERQQNRCRITSFCRGDRDSSPRIISHSFSVKISLFSAGVPIYNSPLFDYPHKSKLTDSRRSLLQNGTFNKLRNHSSFILSGQKYEILRLFHRYGFLNQIVYDVSPEPNTSIMMISIVMPYNKMQIKQVMLFGNYTLYYF